MEAATALIPQPLEGLSLQATRVAAPAPEAAAPAPGLLDLPVLALEHICCHLPLPDRLALSGSCKAAWESLLASKPAWGDIEIAVDPVLEHGGLDTWLARRCPALRRLAIRYEDPLCGPRRLCASSLSGALLLAELELASCWVAWPGLELPGLRRLRLSRVPAEGPPSGDELVRAAPALEALEMDGVPLLRPAALPRLPSTLTRLELRDCRLEGVPWAQVSELGRLEALHLGCNPGLDVSGLHALASLTRLSALSLECCGLHSVEALSALPSLQALGLGGNWLAGARLQPLAALTRLSALGLECCGLRGGLEVLAGLHSLAALDLSWNQELEDNDLRHLPISITHLSLHGWSGLPRALPQLVRLSGLRQLGLRHSGVNTQELARHVQGLVCLTRSLCLDFLG